MSSSPISGRSAATLASIGALALALTLVISSPFALDLVDRTGVNWERRSQIAATYGAVSAVLSALAVVGLIISLLLQISASRQDRLFAVRQLHFDLLKIALDDPRYLACWGYDPAESEKWRLHIYSNLIVAHWRAMWALKTVDADALAALSEGVFAGDVARAYWTQAREKRLTIAVRTRQDRRFFEILDRSYHRSLSLNNDSSRQTPATAHDVTPASRPAGPADDRDR